MKARQVALATALTLGLPLVTQAQQLSRQGSLDLEVLPHVTVTVLVDNMAGSNAVLGEWGASFLVSTDQTQLLFDMGAGQTLISNARALNVDLTQIEAMVISHVHYDHTRGLDAALSASGPVDLYLHPACFETRYFKWGTGTLVMTLPIPRGELQQRARNIIDTKEPTALPGGFVVTGEVPRITDYEDTGVTEYAFLDEDLTIPDPVLDDQAMFFRVPEGLVILLGCAHAGLVNTMEYVAELTGESRIYAVMGGTHLTSASPDRIKKTIEALRRFDVQRIMLSHCTGMEAYAELARAFPGKVSWPGAGRRIQFGGQQ